MKIKHPTLNDQVINHEQLLRSFFEAINYGGNKRTFLN